MPNTALVTLTDAKSFLKITGGTDDTRLQSVINAAARTIEGRVGPIDTATHAFTVYEYGLTGALNLPHTHITGIASVVFVSDGSTALATTDIHIPTEGNIGVLYMKSISGIWPRYPFTVTYTVGRTADANLVEACKQLVQHFWKAQRGQGRAPGASTGSDNVPETLPIPPMVEQMLADPDEQHLAFA
jgi:hypothetical protein